MAPRDKIRLISLNTKEAGAWLHALPVSNIGCSLDDISLRIAIGLMLGAAICVPHTYRCGAEVDETGQHELSCLKSGGRYSRHSELNNTLKRTWGSCHIPSVLESSGLFRQDGKRPDGMAMIPWKNGGKPLVWDVTCVDNLAKSNIQYSLKGPGEAAKQAEEKKRQKYKEIEHEYIFAPFAVETFGSFGPVALEIFNTISKSLILETKDRRAGEYLRQRLSIAIQRGNGVSVLSTLKNNEEKLSEIFYIVDKPK